LDEIVQEFLVESHENLDALDRDLVALEQDPGSRELLSSIFRTIHTIKGTSGFLAFTRLEAITHVGESLLSRLRDGAFELNPEITDVLLRMVDVVRALLASIEEHGEEGELDIAPVMAVVEECLARHGVELPAEPEPSSAPAVEPAPRLGDLLVAADAASPDAIEAAVRRQLDGDERTLGEILVDTGAAAPDAVSEALEQQHRRSIAESSVRVDVAVLDGLMRLVGELVLTRNQVMAHTDVRADAAMARMIQRLNLVTSELQESVMKTRMQPIDTVWNKLPRVVRDLSAACGKSVFLDMTGRDTELDRTLIEAIKDPLTHIVRNAVDHGIETTAQRLEAGKPEVGTLSLGAYHEGGRVIIEVRDDGAGIDREAIAAKALEGGIETREALSRMSDRDVLGLVFRPGFSTAAAVTNVSGRGVGMDVVRTNVEKIGGTVELESEVGVGTTCRLIIPLTLAIVPALTLECAGERYAVPQISLLELVSIDDDRRASAVEMLSGVPVYRLRGRLLPLVHLGDVLDVGRPPETGSLHIAVLHADGRRFGLVVDRVLDTEEIVVKALSQRLKGIGVYSGATILGDGRVALILDVLALAARALNVDARAAAEDIDRENAAIEEVDRILVADVGDDRRVAIPLTMVTRLEEFPASSVERVGSREVVRYRGKILPLVRLSRHLGATVDAGNGRLPVVVYSRSGRSVALAVESIVDIVEERISAQEVDDIGLLGSAVIQDRVTELLDVRRAILAADPNFYSASAPAEDASAADVLVRAEQ
jgi:two-component system chemotaxis sensor kinase CheA